MIALNLDQTLSGIDRIGKVNGVLPYPHLQCELDVSAKRVSVE